MFHRFILFLTSVCLFTARAHSQCALWSLFTSLSANPSTCLPGTNLGKFEVTGTLSSVYFPPTGTLTFSNDSGVSVTLNAPFSSPVNYTLPVAVGHGGNLIVTASFSDYSCTKQKSYTAQTCCTVTPTNMTISVCEHKTLTLAATGTAGGNYFWSGPGGFSSTQQNPTIPNIPTSKAGFYHVYLMNGSCTSPPKPVNVTVNPKPGSKSIVSQ